MTGAILGAWHRVRIQDWSKLSWVFIMPVREPVEALKPCNNIFALDKGCSSSCVEDELSKGRKKNEEIICYQRVDKRCEDSERSRSNSWKAENVSVHPLASIPCSVSRSSRSLCTAISRNQHKEPCSKDGCQSNQACNNTLRWKVGWRRRKTTVPSSGDPENPNMCPQCPRNFCNSNVQIRCWNESETPYNECVFKDPHSCYWDGCQTEPRRTVNYLPDPHTRAPRYRKASRSESRGRRGELFPISLSLHPELMCSFWIGNTRTVGQGRNQKSATYKNIAWHRHCLSRSHPPPLHFFIGSGVCQKGTGFSFL